MQQTARPRVEFYFMSLQQFECRVGADMDIRSSLAAC